MKWFKEKKECFVNDRFMYIDKYVADYIDKLEKQSLERSYEINRLRNELEAIKPIVSSYDYDPAKSRDCVDCKYVVRSSWNGDVLACRKDNLCPNFVPSDELMD